MRKKLISKTYLKDVSKYKLEIYLNQDDNYISVKKIIEIKEPFILPTGLCLIDNGYYIVEIIPKQENYTVRIFLNEDKEKVAYYFDITHGNGLDEETMIPYYDDLYLDVVLQNGKIKVLDEDELEEALRKKMISEEDFILANKTKDLLIDSINNKQNKYINLDLKKFL